MAIHSIHGFQMIYFHYFYQSFYISLRAFPNMILNSILIDLFQNKMDFLGFVYLLFGYFRWKYKNSLRLYQFRKFLRKYYSLQDCLNSYTKILHLSQLLIFFSLNFQCFLFNPMFHWKFIFYFQKGFGLNLTATFIHFLLNLLAPNNLDSYFTVNNYLFLSL
jgi:hypothetical protein